MQAYRLIGKTTRNQVAEPVLKAIMNWQEAWCIDIKQPDIDVEPHLYSPKDSKGFGSQKDGQHTIFCCDQDTNWIKILFGHKSTSCPDDNITGATVKDAKQSFIKHLFESLKINAEPEIEYGAFPFPSLGKDGHLFVRIQINDQVLMVWLSPKVVEQFIPIPLKQKSSSLTKRSEACQAASASVKAKLKLGSFPITLLQSLAVGDVLSTDVKLSTPLQLEINDETSLAVHLGKRDDHKALLFLPNTK